MKYVFPTTRVKRYRFPTHINDLVVDRGDARTSEVFIVVLAPGEAPPLHKHDDTEQVFYVLEGRGTLSVGRAGEHYPVKAGDVVRIPPGVIHSIRCAGRKTLRYLAVDCFLNGCPLNEPTWDAHVRVVCRQQGWKLARPNLVVEKFKR